MDTMNKSLMIAQILKETVKKLMGHVKSGDFCGTQNANLDMDPSDVASADLTQAPSTVPDSGLEEDLIFHVLKKSSSETLSLELADQTKIKMLDFATLNAEQGTMVLVQSVGELPLKDGLVVVWELQLILSLVENKSSIKLCLLERWL